MLLLVFSCSEAPKDSENENSLTGEIVVICSDEKADFSEAYDAYALDLDSEELTKKLADAFDDYNYCLSGSGDDSVRKNLMLLNLDVGKYSSDSYTKQNSFGKEVECQFVLADNEGAIDTSTILKNASIIPGVLTLLIIL